MTSYFSYYSSKCQEFLTDGGRHVSAKTHSDIIEIAQMIQNDLPRETILPCTGDWSANALDTCSLGSANAAIDLCASLLTMIDVGEHEFGVSGRHPIHWTKGCLRTTLRDQFSPERTLAVDNPRIGKLFKAENLSKIAGVKIRWTNNLANHLRLTDDDKAVFIFHHASFLKFQQSLTQQLFPPGFIEETLYTLALLFPQNDSHTRRWIQTLGSPCLDQNISRCGSLRAQDRRFDRFLFWHDRLVVLKQVFDDSSPRTLAQWWWDRRNGVQWYTFWVAVFVFLFTIFFGMVQSVEGALQVYFSYKAQPG
ncbi:hypothetical protein JDV02_001966 [Purpureocillium takamizusanense]|uniref:Uncharacterized protein n=1 Tax=Purpureocillium takamizusanense TaxID=2060973 RepID=A0A9Q8QA09_9HYPO|nr:uncharacterized protein JDV02_001966 [Purpureocillium takamizusanense]UNI15431.1 hypothetical protein JDV02_001966 [Purpureocillium takamizusanense]